MFKNRLKRFSVLGLSLLWILTSCGSSDNPNGDREVPVECDLSGALVTLKQATSYKVNVESTRFVSYGGKLLSGGYDIEINMDSNSYEYVLSDKNSNALSSTYLGNIEEGVMTYSYDDSNELVKGKLLKKGTTYQKACKTSIFLMNQEFEKPLNIQSGDYSYTFDTTKSRDLNLVKDFFNMTLFDYDEEKANLSNLTLSYDSDTGKVVFEATYSSSKSVKVAFSNLGHNENKSFNAFLNSDGKALAVDEKITSILTTSSSLKECIKFYLTGETNDEIDKAYLNLSNETPFIYIDYAKEGEFESLGETFTDSIIVRLNTDVASKDSIYSIPVGADFKPTIDINDKNVLKNYDVFSHKDALNIDSTNIELYFKTALYYVTYGFAYTSDYMFISDYDYTFETSNGYTFNSRTYETFVSSDEDLLSDLDINLSVNYEDAEAKSVLLGYSENDVFISVNVSISSQNASILDLYSLDELDSSTQNALLEAF